MTEPSENTNSSNANERMQGLLIEAESLPEASFLIRLVAFLLDYLLLSFISFFIITQIILPQNSLLSMDQLIAWLEAYTSWLETEKSAAQSTAVPMAIPMPMPMPSIQVRDTLSLISESFTLIFFTYFFIGDFALKGSSIGKKIFNIRTLSLIQPIKIPVFHALIRSMVKTMMLFHFFPIILLIAFATKFLHKRKSWGHDIVSHTIVVDEFKLSKMLHT